MLERSVKIHDRFQSEIKLDYKLDPTDRIKSYDIAAYFFVPVSLGINPKAYSRQDIFGDLLSHIRLKTPNIPLQNLVTDSNSPLAQLSFAVNKLSERATNENIVEFEYHLKMFC